MFNLFHLIYDMMCLKRYAQTIFRITMPLTVVNLTSVGIDLQLPSGSDRPVEQTPPPESWKGIPLMPSKDTIFIVTNSMREHYGPERQDFIVLDDQDDSKPIKARTFSGTCIESQGGTISRLFIGCPITESPPTPNVNITATNGSVGIVHIGPNTPFKWGSFTID